MAKVSLIIPTFNRPELLPRAVESASRAGADVEVIVVDDGSVDETASVCAKLSGINYVRLDSNRGVAAARNAGLRASNSEFLGFLDDDDLRLPGSIDAQIELLASQPDAGMVYGQALFGDDDCEPKGGLYPDECPQGDIFWQIMERNFVPCLAVLFRRACLDRVGMLDESAAGIDDWDLWIRIAELYPVLATPKPVAIWRQPTPKSGQLSFQAGRRHRCARRLHRDKWRQLPRSQAATQKHRSKAARAFADRAMQQMFWEAESQYKAGLRLESMRLAFEMARLYPRSLFKKLIGASNQSHS